MAFHRTPIPTFSIERLSDVWEEVETKFTCPACGTGTVSRKTYQRGCEKEKYNRYFCPLCGHTFWRSFDVIRLEELDCLQEARRES